ncbi:hypothetical protein CG651_002789 [Salmonella enterica]|nr:hypothetical protein [Salmonella enterica]
MIAQAVTELDNKAAYRKPPVLERHTPFFDAPLTNSFTASVALAISVGDISTSYISL